MKCNANIFLCVSILKALSMTILEKIAESKTTLYISYGLGFVMLLAMIYLLFIRLPKEKPGHPSNTIFYPAPEPTSSETLAPTTMTSQGEEVPKPTQSIIEIKGKIQELSNEDVKQKWDTFKEKTKEKIKGCYFRPEGCTF